ncbi:hypothetical protein CLV98_10310 [Dyadobacter jejuensis]|uniref:Uncharacterized protein n=1 Tax=Dyadobacter jejuensis TaxID=1082580 RepID=A0A316ALG9_9BACT|nr:DUF6157 family protein [Dyadobacter jejuensis]PWJ58645.1 hypothetical protein CLV98_10310 [Dyadobacter jejuensis]
MKTNSTNYYDTFLEVAEDTKATCGLQPPTKVGKTSVAEIQYELISQHPYGYTSDEVVFMTHTLRSEGMGEESEQEKDLYFSKGRPCLRTSPLTKTYGFGIHYNSEGKMALYGVETPEYAQFVADQGLAKVKAMRTKRG